ncbi:hypothetical protein B0H17DRAFT_1212287 [Mycena rosella]|uniref:Uncharacterized protein n=1 Tax=Mycena rosella TaxID=1033263 RepID=A0AAD7G362_MYCRO|nr:hypothetical protein B0H17DRAFT_1212287 [Mycena rosella]
MDSTLVTNIYWEFTFAVGAVEEAKAAILSLIGFIAWISTVSTHWNRNLLPSQRDYIASLRLGEQSKVGVLLKLSRDYQEMNIPHLTAHDVPIFYPWTNDEEGQGRFVHYSPEFLRELTSVKNGRGNGDIMVYELPSFDKWRDNLERYDQFGQDRFSERRGIVFMDFQPWYKYHIVDGMLYGARPLQNWKTIRAYAEHFRCTVQTYRNKTVCTFFRQSPLRADDPSHRRGPPIRHLWLLTQFADGNYGDNVDEVKAFWEDKTLIREQVKNKWAPRPGRTFNSYNGRLDAPGREMDVWELEGAPVARLID